MRGSLKRTVLVVIDGVGIGATPDAGRYGDEGAHTLGNTARKLGGLRLPNLQKMGLGLIDRIEGVEPVDEPQALVGKMAERSAGKDTSTGHWEIAGVVTEKPFPTYPEGFPKEMVDEFVEKAKLPGVLGNITASGTEIIKELGEEHVRTGKPILYTSADSVFQIAAHEEAFGLERLYCVCKIARELTLPHQISRVIARPFVGQHSEDFVRTGNRSDYSIDPPENCLDLLYRNGVGVYSVGKIDDIFAHRSITKGDHTKTNQTGLEATLRFMKETRNEKVLIFVNLVDFDMLYGHRRDVEGFAKALHEFDDFVPKLLGELEEGDSLIITADHGCDPTFKGSDHTREHVPLLAYFPGQPGKHIGIRESFADVAATLLDGYGISAEGLPGVGRSLLCK